MSCLRQGHCWLAAAVAAAIFASLSSTAQTGTNAVPRNAAPVTLTPPAPQVHSPVDFFRRLLAMSPAERESYLTNKPPEVRARLMDKAREYLVLDPDDRELRLQATELRWYLLPLLRQSPTNRAGRLASVPPNLRGLVDSRLQQWDALSAPFQQEFLDNERTLRYFARVDLTNGLNVGDERRGPDSDDQARWNALSGDEQQKITGQFNQFFSLTADEKQKTLNTLSDAERRQMEKTLLTFSNLPPAQRIQCLRAFSQFASMPSKERVEFLKSAERWAEMSPKERQAWRDLVSQVPQWPPLPASIMPPLPPKVVPRKSMVATNVD